MSEQNHFLSTAQLSDSDDLVLIFQSQLMVRDASFLWKRQDISIKEVVAETVECILIEHYDESAIIVVNLRQDISSSLQAELSPLRSLLLSLNQNEFALAAKAFQLIDWCSTHKFCGTCGCATKTHAAERALVCVNCSKHYFPRINPCVIVLVVKDRQMLLARTSRIKSSFYSCLAGFIEIGETPEETVKREVKEEVNIEVANIRYIKSQSWPFPSQLMLGFLADYHSGDIIPEPTEIAEANWYDIDSLPTVPSARISVAGELIEHFVAKVKSAETSQL